MCLNAFVTIFTQEKLLHLATVHYLNCGTWQDRRAVAEPCSAVEYQHLGKSASKLFQGCKTKTGIPLLLLNNAVAYREKLRRKNFQVCISTNAPFIHFCNNYFVKQVCSQKQSFSRKKNLSHQQSKL